MATSLEGEYTHSTVEDLHTNTQDGSQEEGPKWIPNVVETSTSTVEYQEGAGAIGGPEANTKEYVIKDDLITKYNFQNCSDNGMSISLSVYNEGDGSATGGSLDHTSITGIPKGYRIHASTCYDENKVLSIYLSWRDEEGKWQETEYASVRLTTDFGYKVMIWQYYDKDKQEWDSVYHNEVVDGMQIRACVKARDPIAISFSSYDASTGQPGGGVLDLAYYDQIPAGSHVYWNGTYEEGTVLEVTSNKGYNMVKVNITPESGKILATWQYYHEESQQWIGIPEMNAFEVFDGMKIRAVVTNDSTKVINAAVYNSGTADRGSGVVDKPIVVVDGDHEYYVDYDTSYEEGYNLTIYHKPDEHTIEVIDIITLARDPDYELVRWEWYNYGAYRWETIDHHYVYQGFPVRAVVHSKCY